MRGHSSIEFCRLGTLLGAILSYGVHAAPPLSWRSSIEVAAKNNAELQSARESLEATQAQARAAFSGFLPQASASLSYTRSATAGVSDTSYAATLSASDNLFSGFQDKARVDQAQSNEKISEAAFAAAKAKLSFDLKSAFEGLRYAQESIKLTEDIIRRREANLGLVQLRFESGRENKGSFLLSQAYLAEAKYEDLVARHGLQTAWAQLARVLGEDDVNDYEVSEDVPVTEVGSAPDFKSLVAATPDHAQALSQKDSARAALALARGNFFPSLALSASAGRLGADFFPSNNRWSLGAGISLPLFSGGKDYYSASAASSTLAAAALNLHTSDRQVLTKLRQAWASYTEAIEKLKVDRTFVQAVRVRAEVTRNKYNNGLASFEDWDGTENDLIARQKSLLQSQRDRVVTEAAWEQAQGKGAIP